LVLSPTGSINLGFTTEGRLDVVLIIPSLGVPNWSVIYINTAPSAAGLKKPFYDIQDNRARSWTIARVVCNKNMGFAPTLVRSEDLAAYKKLVDCDAQKQEGTFSGDVLIEGLGPEHPGRTRGVSSIVPWKTGCD
jgi:hypothetical protein